MSKKSKPKAPAPTSGDMRIELVALSDLRRWPRNPKKHNHDGIEHSMERFGFVRPFIVDEGTGRLVAGHGGLETLQRRRDAGEAPPGRIVMRKGEWFVPVVRGISFANPEEAEDYLLADNRLNEIGGYEEKLLATMVKERLVLGEEKLLGLGWSVGEAKGLVKLLDDGQLGGPKRGGTEDDCSGLAGRSERRRAS